MTAKAGTGGSVRADSRRAAEGGTVTISRARLAVMTVLLLLSATLCTLGFVSSLKREEPLKDALQSENVQNTLRQWLDSFGYGSMVVADPNSDFVLVINMPGSGKRITVAREKALNRYVAVGFSLTFSPEDQAAIAKLSEAGRTRLFLDARIELDRAGADTTLLSQAQIVCVKRIPITNSLTEDVLIRTVNSLENAEDLILNTMARDLPQPQPSPTMSPR